MYFAALPNKPSIGHSDGTQRRLELFIASLVGNERSYPCRALVFRLDAVHLLPHLGLRPARPKAPAAVLPRLDRLPFGRQLGVGGMRGGDRAQDLEVASGGAVLQRVPDS